MKDDPLLTDKEIEDIRHQANRATPGPWWISPELGDRSSTSHVMAKGAKDKPDQDIATIVNPQDPQGNTLLVDAEFIADCRENVPRLCRSLRRARGEETRAMFRVEEAEKETARLRDALQKIAWAKVIQPEPPLKIIESLKKIAKDALRGRE